MLGDERGVALPLALGVTIVLSSLAAGIFTYVTTNQGASERARADQRSYGLAEAGLSYAFSVLSKAVDADPYNPPPASALPSTAAPAAPSGAEYWGTLSGTTWTLYGMGTVPNPSGPSGAPVVRTVSMQVLVTTVTAGDTRPWNYLFIDQPSGCFELENTVTLEVSLYVRGDLCLENNVLVKSPAVHVLGNVYISNNASIGTSSSPINEFLATGNCYYGGVVQTCGTPASRIWAGSVGATPPSLTKPPVDLPYWYANADLGPGALHNCTTGSFPGGSQAFDNDGTMNVSRGSIDLTPSTGYDCQRVVAGQTVGQITWAPGSNPSQTGILTVTGTIFFDGNLTWTNLSKIDYNGRATIYASGTLTIQNQARLCGVADCDATWDPSDDFITFVVGSLTTSGTTDDTGDVGNNVNLQGALYLVNDYDQDNNTTIWGPVIARNATITNAGLFKPLPGDLGDLVPGMPASTTTVTQFQTVPGSYAG
jgi:Tfp pilus assembly protein PilX